MRNGSNYRRRRWQIAGMVLLGLAPGCCKRMDVHYLGAEKHSYYRAHATEVEFAAVNVPSTAEVVHTAPPHTIRETGHTEIREITIAEVIQITLQNSDILRTAGAFLTPGSVLGTNDRVASAYDPAIQETGVLFGGRGVEAALAAFDAQLNASVVWGRNEVIQNNEFFGGGAMPGSTLVTETSQFQAGLTKAFAHGGIVSLNHNVNYLGSNAPGQLFPSAYTGNVALLYQLPLLAGSGTEFTRIAGPIGQSFGGLTGVSQGVVIARINQDISIADFEASLRNLVKDAEDAYWDLYLAYQNFDTAVQARNDTLETWRKVLARLEAGTADRIEETQALDQYYALEAAANNARSQLYTAEIRLRRLMGLATNDGTVLRPADEPVTAELIPDWYLCLTEALTRREELRRQKWNIKSLELQHKAAESLVRPRLDFVGGYQVNGFGDDLIGYDYDNRLDNFYESITQGDQTGWNMGLQLRWDIGFRSQLAQVRNYELRLAKARRVLQEQEEEVSHELAVSFQELARAHAAAEVNRNRVEAARKNVEVTIPAAGVRTGFTIDNLLRAQTRLAQAELAYHESVVGYNKALTDLQFRKGTLLPHNGIFIAEGGWAPEAYEDAKRNSSARAHAMRNPFLHTSPPPFSGDSPFGGVYFTHPENSMAPDAPSEPGPVPAEGATPIEEKSGIAPMVPAEVEPASPTIEPTRLELPPTYESETPAIFRIGHGTSASVGR